MTSSRTGRRQVSWWAGLVAVGVVGGCGGLPGRKPVPLSPASTSLLDSGPTHKVTGKEAADVQFAIGRSHEEADKLDEAAGAYRSALGKDPKRADVEARLAVVLDRKGEPDEADQHFEKALKLDPKNPDLLCDRGYGFYLRGKPTEAEKSLRSALALAPKHPRSHTNLALVLAARGDSDGAMTEFHRAGTDVADSRSNLALALALDGKVEAARDQYAQALAAKPGSKPATEGLRIAATVLNKKVVPPGDLPRLPGAAGPVVATAPRANDPLRVDPALIPSSMAR